MGVPLRSAVLDKFADYIDFFSSALRGPGGDVGDITRRWMDEFFFRASQRIAQTEDPIVEMERIKEEFGIRLQFARQLEELRREVDPRSGPELLNWKKVNEGLVSADVKIFGSLNEWLGRQWWARVNFSIRHERKGKDGT